MKKNLELEFYRFVMTLMVAILHFSEDYAGNHGPFPGAYLGVDFFFILSGFFLMRSYEKKQYGDTQFKNTIGFFVHRLKRLYPPYIIATMLMLLTTWILNGGGLMRIFKQLWSIQWQLVCLHFIGMPAGYNMRSVWFISSLLLLSWVIFFFLDYNKTLFLGVAPISSILLLAYIARKYGTLSMQGEAILIFNGGMIRGFAEMSLGVVMAYILESSHEKNMLHLKELKYTPLLIRFFCYGLILSIIHFRGFDSTDFSIVPAFLLLLLVAESYPVFTSRGGVLVKIISFFGKISYWVYLLHLIISKILSELIGKREFTPMLFVFLVITLVISTIIERLYSCVLRLVTRH